MTVRIVTWNVNGIRNPFKYSPWNKDRSLKAQAMFDILEADIVCFQEVKTPKASLTDDLVFVDGWDTFYSFPHTLTGYSGVAVYTRDSKCVPLRVEEGVTGVLKIPGTQTRYVDAQPDKQIGGYPTDRQLRRAAVGREVIDSEGRCLILEFPLFVLINVYCPARRNHERTGYRNTFLLALDVRIRNLAAAGKNVVLCGDLNIMRDQLDTAGIWGHQGQKMMSEALEFDENYMTMRAPKLLSQLLFNSRTVSDTGTPFIDDAVETRRPPVLYDTCRELHPERTGMFTCWDTRKNHRPANFGSRIDLIMCSPKVMQLVQEADIQPHLLGSDHCPVYAVLQAAIEDGGEEKEDDPHTKRKTYSLDYLNPPGRFVGGQNVLPPDEDTALLKTRFPQSARRMPQFSNRRHIASMFQKTPKLPATASVTSATQDAKSSVHPSERNGSARKGPAGVQSSAPELPAILKAEAVELVESDDEDGGAGTIEDDDVAVTAEEEGEDEDERPESVAGPADSTQPLSDIPAARDDDRGSRPPALHANIENTLSAVVSPSLPSRPLSETDNVAANESQRGHVSETSAVRRYDEPSQSTDLPSEGEMGRTPAGESSLSESRPSRIQSFWGGHSGVPKSREQRNDGDDANGSRDSGDSGDCGAASSLLSSTPKPKTTVPLSQSLTPSLLPTGTLRRSLSGTGGSNTSSVRPSSSVSARPAKKAKTSASASSGTQMSMNMFLTARPANNKAKENEKETEREKGDPNPPTVLATPETEAVHSALDEAATTAAANDDDNMWMTAEEVDAAFRSLDAAKASWSRLGLGQRQTPLCEHGEPCKTFVTKKAGVNSGRSFYMCARPPGPLGKREKGTAWQCTTFVWCRDWRPDRPEVETK
ncbi:AP endonuclease 2 [Sporothrix schenckii 1099-18]|uniref:DNA-(apurinic or apyrimidinic site) endonuclease 2 n=1 Tax=Sporothrix schenckii 1099-18 TaxID=1397361 RepID=A0A0F2MKL2_SPOSC|nr:AP endonuclease 2 [Sporothrix schenckii 1099-18]KJR89594.1 AP endonuclease 2 [Sporothrix schenckii 1099-18]